MFLFPSGFPQKSRMHAASIRVTHGWRLRWPVAI